MATRSLGRHLLACQTLRAFHIARVLARSICQVRSSFGSFGGTVGVSLSDGLGEAPIDESRCWLYALVTLKT